jgi:sn-glycerol 3-phosphate transport system permease protein
MVSSAGLSAIGLSAAGTAIAVGMLLALAGAGGLGMVFRQRRQSLALGGLIGAASAGLGTLMFLLPLGFCTFEPERSGLDRGFGFFLLALGAGLLWSLAYWATGALHRRNSALQPPGESGVGMFKTHWLVPWLLLLPTLGILVVFIYYPALDTFSLATQIARLSTPRTQFVCVRNFTEIISPSYGLGDYSLGLATVLGAGLLAWGRQGYGQTVVYRSGQWLWRGVAIATLYQFVMGLWSDYYRLIFFNTGLVAAATVGLGLTLSLGLAVLVYQPVQGSGIYRTLLVWSYAISPAVAGVIFAIMFNPVAGVVNHLLGLVGLPGQPWLTDPTLARAVLILASIWKQLGYNILFYLAGLQTVPSDLLEAATLDGANAWQRFRRIVLPALSPITFFLIITNLTYTFFEVYGTIDYLTRGGPNGATAVAIYEIIRVGIRGDRDLGRAAAQSIILLIMVIGVTLLQFRTSGRRVNYSA